MVHGRTLKCPQTGRFLKPDEIVFDEKNNPLMKSNSMAPLETWEKMSKSKYNGVDPTEMVKKYGADTVRIYILFKAPAELVLNWDESDIVGSQRWLQRMVRLVETFSVDSPTRSCDKFRLECSNLLYYIDRDVSQNYKFNTAIALMMKLSNLLSIESNQMDTYFSTALENLIIMMFPFAPHTSAELYSLFKKRLVNVGLDYDIRKCNWPSISQQTKSSVANIIVQVDGKTKQIIELEAGLEDESKFIEAVFNSVELKEEIKSLAYKKLISKPGKLINLVL